MRLGRRIFRLILLRSPLLVLEEWKRLRRHFSPSAITGARASDSKPPLSAPSCGSTAATSPVLPPQLAPSAESAGKAAGTRNARERGTHGAAGPGLEPSTATAGRTDRSRPGARGAGAEAGELLLYVIRTTTGADRWLRVAPEDQRLKDFPA